MPETAPASAPSLAPGGQLQSLDWKAIRAAFIDRTDRPSFAELGEEFNCPIQKLMRVSSEEGWTSLRAAKLETRLQESDAASALLRAVKYDTTVVHLFADVAIETLNKLKQVVDDIDRKRAPSGRASVLNTVGFALANVAAACARVGIVGMPKTLKEAAANGAGQWSSQMLGNLNVTVQNIVAAKEQQVASVAIDAQPAPDQT